MRIILVDKPKGMYLLDEINKMVISVLSKQGVDFTV